MKSFSGAAVEIGDLGDHRVRSIAWSPSGEDLMIGLSGPGEPGRRLMITFVWATEVTIRMSFGGYSGQPLVWGASVTPGPAGTGWLVRLQFGGAPEGHIQLVCDEIRVEEA